MSGATLLIMSLYTNNIAEKSSIALSFPPRSVEGGSLAESLSEDKNRPATEQGVGPGRRRSSRRSSLGSGHSSYISDFEADGLPPSTGVQLTLSPSPQTSTHSTAAMEAQARDLREANRRTLALISIAEEETQRAKAATALARSMDARDQAVHEEEVAKYEAELKRLQRTQELAVLRQRLAAQSAAPIPTTALPNGAIEPLLSPSTPNTHSRTSSPTSIPPDAPASQGSSPADAVTRATPQTAYSQELPPAATATTGASQTSRTKPTQLPLHHPPTFFPQPHLREVHRPARRRLCYPHHQRQLAPPRRLQGARARGGTGSLLDSHFKSQPSITQLHRFSRRPHPINFLSPHIRTAAGQLSCAWTHNPQPNFYHNIS